MCAPPFLTKRSEGAHRARSRAVFFPGGVLFIEKQQGKHHPYLVIILFELQQYYGTQLARGHLVS